MIMQLKFQKLEFQTTNEETCCMYSEVFNVIAE